MEKTVSFYEKAFSDSVTAKEILYSHQITQPSTFNKFRIGFSDGSIMVALPKKGKIIDDLQDLGVLLKDKEFFSNCLTFPIYDKENNIINGIWFFILTCAALVAGAWWHLMPQGFPMGHLRFWVNTAFPLVYMLGYVTYIAMLMKGSYGLKKVMAWGFTAFIVVAAILLNIVFPASSQSTVLLPVVAAAFVCPHHNRLALEL